ncbi:tRNA (adenosine(37)-N6)-threonylcarbamoyltransferase complex ATPase subunit type 1 TsaE [Marinobacter bryozoorum]|uniref:tRNA (adenosine(37)-N6)-threonylcarbamoyltransferase complex ATPase subunit type 1 TsaE n=1 Tax=Marinobacter bryozoorum TaxID=256324 RepID=UPI002004B3FB|nr:tRNA (adenosine(37)-N6)-threonylcarbamoyltransferase complex ATPase subunit type 1 TsaE [Marinobacter bryozoorum]MCK7542846.1 tRNA (adenosine(37)-N6)-threonylcarbamoyltransferase complex ATPase subunit type 1 TsaE [Marinobacter bryozoorum]
MTEQTVWLADEAATVAAGKSLANAVRSVASAEGVVIFLHGTLGAGKTTFSRGFIQGLGHQGAVKSPTYTLVEPYEQLQPATWHFDLYRLGDPEELEFMGIRDYLAPGNACLVEWPERGEGILPVPDLELTLTPERGGRSLAFQARSDTGRVLLHRLTEQRGFTAETMRSQTKTDQD